MELGEPTEHRALEGLGIITRCLLRLEKACVQRIRRSSRLRKILFVSASTLVVCVGFLPVFLTGTLDFAEADAVCYERVLRMGKDNPERKELDMQDNPAYRLTPGHIFTTASMAVSLLCWLVWLFFSSHVSGSSSAKALDRKCNSQHACSGPICYFLCPLCAPSIICAYEACCISTAPVWPCYGRGTDTLFRFPRVGNDLG